MVHKKMWVMTPGGQVQCVPETLASAVYMDETGQKNLLDALQEIELTPGPPGPPGADGADGPPGPPGADGSPDTAAQILAKIGILPVTNGGTGKQTLAELFTALGIQAAINNAVKAAKLAENPVGSILLNVSGANPSTYIGGTWVAWGSGRVPVGIDVNDADFNTVEKIGGSSTHTLAVNETPSHTHIQNAHNHVQDAHSHDYNRNASDGDAFEHLYISSSAGARLYSSGSQSRVSRGYMSIYGAQPFIYNATPTNQYTGGGAAHNNKQKYITCYMWKRTV